MLRLEKHVFNQLCIELVEHGLKGSKRMGVQEMVTMFVHMLGHWVGNRNIQERFQHSAETVSRHFHHVLVSCHRLTFNYIKSQDSRFHVAHKKLKDNKRCWPFFKDAIRAIDGTHIQCAVSSSEQPSLLAENDIQHKM